MLTLWITQRLPVPVKLSTESPGPTPKIFVSKRKSRNRLVYVLPNLFTTANLYLGFFSILSAAKGNFSQAAIAILLAALTDGLDGRVARATHTESEFGEQFDSMSDLASFGLAPALLMYHWALAPWGRWGWMVAFVYLTCAALRLARFNVLKQNEEKRYFQGCPALVAVCTAAAGVLFYQEMGFQAGRSEFILGVMGLLGLLMVSSVRYRSFKDLNFKTQRNFGTIFAIVLFVALIISNPEKMFFPFALLYLVTGLSAEGVRALRRRYSWVPGQGRS